MTHHEKLMELSKQGYRFMDIYYDWFIDYEQTEKYCDGCPSISSDDCYQHVIIRGYGNNDGYCSYKSEFHEPECIKNLKLPKELFKL